MKIKFLALLAVVSISCGVCAATLPMDSEHWDLSNGYFTDTTAVVQVTYATDPMLTWTGDALTGISYNCSIDPQSCIKWSISFGVEVASGQYSGIEILNGTYRFYSAGELISSGTLENWTTDTDTAVSIVYNASYDELSMFITYDTVSLAQQVEDVGIDYFASVLNQAASYDGNSFEVALSADGTYYAIPEPSAYAAAASLAALAFCAYRRFRGK